MAGISAFRSDGARAAFCLAVCYAKMVASERHRRWRRRNVSLMKRRVGASQAVLCFYLVGVPAVMLVERLECQAVIPSLHGTTTLVGVDLGGRRILKKKEVGHVGHHR